MKTIADRCFNILSSLTPESRLKAGIISSFSDEKLFLNCYICKNVFSVIAKNLMNKSLARCSKCRAIIPKGDSFRERFPELSKEWSLSNRTTLDRVWFQSEEKFLWRCSLNHQWKDTPLFRSLGRQCVKCYGRKQPEYSKSLEYLFPELMLEWSPENSLNPKFITYGSNIFAKWVCLKGHEWIAQVNSRTRPKSTGCPECSNKSFQSKGEIQMIDFITKLGYEGKTSERSLINPYELDFYSESLGLAVEFNGDYFHSDNIVYARHALSSRDYHLLKKRLCERKGVSLAYVWESDWSTNQEVIKEELKTFFDKGFIGECLSILSKS